MLIDSGRVVIAYLSSYNRGRLFELNPLYVIISSVQVRKRPLNKKEMTKKEEDIITIERMSNSLTVHEKKYKVSV